MDFSGALGRQGMKQQRAIPQVISIIIFFGGSGGLGRGGGWKLAGLHPLFVIRMQCACHVISLPVTQLHREISSRVFAANMPTGWWHERS